MERPALAWNMNVVLIKLMGDTHTLLPKAWPFLLDYAYAEARDHSRARICLTSWQTNPHDKGSQCLIPATFLEYCVLPFPARALTCHLLFQDHTLDWRLPPISCWASDFREQSKFESLSTCFNSFLKAAPVSLHTSVMTEILSNDLN